LTDEIKKYRTELKTWYKELKTGKSCELCGSNKKKQFHHKEPEEKMESVAQMVHKGYSKEIILAEIDKCIIVCARCHCKIHAEMKRKKKLI
jgi:hypothetical protein